MNPVDHAALLGGAPEKIEVTIGFMPLTDCASVVIATELGLFHKYGLNVTLSREASWAAIRDKLSLGLLDAAHALYGLIYGVHTGIGGPKMDMAVLMGLNRNGQAIVLSNELAAKGAVDGPSLKKLIERGEREYVFAQTFPTGTHAMWLYYWLASAGIDPLRDVKSITVPPSQMVANLRAGNMDGYCVGEPWAERALVDGSGFTAIASQGIWRNHPEKVLGSTREFVLDNPHPARALVAAILEASRYIDNPANHERVASIIADERYVGATPELIAGRLHGAYRDGRGTSWTDPNHMKFFDDGEVNFPYISHGMWFLTQHQRWGLIPPGVNFREVAQTINQVALYSDVARALGVAVPDAVMKKEELFDGVLWDPEKPEQYLAQFAVKG